MRRTIIFKVPEFPHLSETFIVAQIVTAIDLGYDVQIMVRRVLDYKGTSLLIEKYDLMNKVIVEDYEIPKNKLKRLFSWSQILLSNLSALPVIYRYHLVQDRFSLTWLFQWSFYQRFAEADIFHVQYGTNTNPLPHLKLAGGYTPALIATFHGHDAFFPINGYIPNNGYYDKLFETCTLITVNTPYLEDQLISLGCPEEKLSVVPVGVDTLFFNPKNRVKTSGALRLLNVGRLDRVKGHSYCIQVIQILVDRGLDISLTIVGEGTERSSLETQILEAGLQGKVFLAGSRQPQEVRKYYRSHDIYLLLAVPLADGRRETQGLATLEAQACGMPVIVFDSGGVKHTLRDGESGFVCEEFNVVEVADKIEMLCCNRSVIDRMGSTAVNFVQENYSQRLINERWKRIYNGCNNK